MSQDATPGRLADYHRDDAGVLCLVCHHRIASIAPSARARHEQSAAHRLMQGQQPLPIVVRR